MLVKNLVLVALQILHFLYKWVAWSENDTIREEDFCSVISQLIAGCSFHDKRVYEPEIYLDKELNLQI